MTVFDRTVLWLILRENHERGNSRVKRERLDVLRNLLNGPVQ